MFYLKSYILAAVLGITLLKVITTNNLENFQFTQNDYKINFERAEIVRYNKNYVYFFKVTTFKHNRTCTAFNFTYKYKTDLEKLEVIVQAYKFASNEYRMFPLRFQIGFCVAFNKNIAGFGDFTKCRNFNDCPLNKEKEYHICNFAPDETKFPPFIPNGKYMLEITGLHRSIEIWVSRGYAEVYRPFKEN